MLIRYRLLVPAILLSCLGVLPVQATILTGPDIIAPPLSTASVGGGLQHPSTGV